MHRDQDVQRGDEVVSNHWVLLVCFAAGGKGSCYSRRELCLVLEESCREFG